MTPPTKSKRFGATPGKLVLIAVLAVTLVSVVVLQLPDSKSAAGQPEANQEDSRQETAQSRINSKSRSESTTEVSRGMPVKSWPRIPVETAIQVDPFALPPWARATPVAGPKAGPASNHNSETPREPPVSLETLKKQHVSIVIVADGQKVAKLGKRDVRVGDEIGGFVVAEINMDGIVLETREVE